MRVARVAQETLDALRQAMTNTRIMCAVMLDTKVRAGRLCPHDRCCAPANML